MASVVVSLLHSLRFMVRSRASLHLEIIALRHQLAVVNRSRRPRLRFTSADRMLWAWLSRSWRGWRSAVHIVKPETVIAWHRRGFRLFWTWKSRHRTGRPAVPHDVRALIREMSTANPLWGAPRIHGELQKLGISVSQSTVAKYMRRHPRPPSQTWRTFLTNHASQIMAADLFVVPTVTFRLLFVLVILAHERRRIVHVAVTEHPTAAWTAQQLRNAFPENEAPRYLLHDRDAVFADVATTIAGMNIQAVRTARVVATCAKTESRSCRRYRGASFSGKAFRSCCAVHAAVGCSVTATWTIRRRSCAKMTRTKSSRKVTVGTTKRSAAMIWLA